MKVIAAGIVFTLLAIGNVFAAKLGPLVSAQWLNDNLSSKDLVLLDIRSPRTNRDFYAEGHVTGAISAPYNDGWRTKLDGVVGMLPPVKQISRHIGQLGIGNKDHVVILPFGNSSTDFSAATRVYWTFKVLGHDKVSILEGGYAAWLANGFQLSKKPTVREARQFKPNFRPGMIASQADVKEYLASGEVRLIDARPRAQFKGKAKSPMVSRAGTIPNAYNLPQSVLYNPRKVNFIDVGPIMDLIKQRGIDAAKPLVTFCNTGHWASIAWFALSEVLGKKEVSLYDGSMVEWAAGAENPIQ